MMMDEIRSTNTPTVDYNAWKNNHPSCNVVAVKMFRVDDPGQVATTFYDLFIFYQSPR